MNIKELIECGTAITLQVSPLDLKEFALAIISETKAMMAANEKKVDKRLSAKEAAELLGKSTNCLWRWQRDGILNPSGYCGRNPYYYQSHIDKFLNN